jgi:hypothetical protein
MKASKIILDPRLKKTLYLTTALLWISGAFWLYYKYFGQIQGEYGLQAHPAQPILLQVHGAMAMISLILFGMLLMQHVPMGWKQNRERYSGVSLIGICSLLIITGWGLYYVGNASARSAASKCHWVLGLLFPVIIFIHIQLGRRQSKKMKTPPFGL